MSQSFRSKIFSALLGAASLLIASPAFAEGYIGVMGGWGFPISATGLKSEPAIGATVGWRLMPELSIAATWQHDYFKTDTAPVEADVGVTQWMGEANFFTLFGLNGGLHAGIVKADALGGLASSSDFGFGAHLGMDFPIAPSLTLGLAGYYTYVAADDAYSIVNVLVPLKYAF